jgi:hypothetical protein
MARTVLGRVGVGQLEEMNLSVTHTQPGPGIAQIRAVGVRLEPEQVAIEGQRTRRVRNDEAYVVYGCNLRHG